MHGEFDHTCIVLVHYLHLKEDGCGRMGWGAEGVRKLENKLYCIASKVVAIVTRSSTLKNNGVHRSDKSCF